MIKKILLVLIFPPYGIYLLIKFFIRKVPQIIKFFIRKVVPSENGKVLEKNLTFDDKKNVELEKQEPDDINWDTTFSTNSNEENNTIHRNGVFLVGDASIAMPPHIAQAGNQTLEDAAFIKKCLQENNDFKQMISMFIKQRYIKRNIISKKSRSIGKILSTQKLMGHFRNLTLKSYGNEILETVLNPIWTTEINE